MSSIKMLRKKAGMTQKDLADKIGVAQTTVAMWESRKNRPQTAILIPLAAALNCRIDDLLLENAEEGAGGDGSAFLSEQRGDENAELDEKFKDQKRNDDETGR